MVKVDFLKECMDGVPQGPVSDFVKLFCSRCCNRGCSRSIGSSLAFDRRTAEWKKSLFDEVPRASDDDPRFASFRAKRFVVLTDGQPEVRTDPWASAQAAPPAGPDPRTQAAGEESGAPEASQTQDLAPAPAPIPDRPRPPTPVIGNTPFVQGAVIAGAPKREVELENSGTFTFGDGDE